MWVYFWYKWEIWEDEMIVAGCVMFTWVLMVGWTDVCCSESGEMWGVDESEGDLHLGKRWLVDYDDDDVCVCVCVCVCAFQSVNGWWLVKSDIDVLWKFLGYVTISNVLLTCCFSVLCTCGCVSGSWGRLTNGCSLGVNLVLGFGALLFSFLFHFGR